MKKTLIINGRVFEECRNAYKEIYYNSLYDAYTKPSYRKESIFEDWKDWTHICNRCTRYGIHSRNSQFFTITGTIIEGGEMYDFTITPVHNYISRRFSNE